MWLRRKNERNTESEPVRCAREAAERAEERRRNISAQWDVVDRISGDIKKVLKENHFGEQLTLAALRRNSQ